MLNITEAQIRAIGDLLNDERRPLKERFRALFTLRNIAGPVAMECINRAFTDSSALLKHELAYCLGQMQDEGALEILMKVLEDESEDPMVRHEAAEAIGAIGAPASTEILQKYRHDRAIEVAETCELALERMRWLRDRAEGAEGPPANPYNSVDPAPPLDSTDVEELKRILLDGTARLFLRYEAMFSLRNVQSEGAVLALCEALSCGGALFRHEVAFVLGQLRHSASVPYLSSSLADETESEMVRHECAEALGSIASRECLDVLNRYLADGKRVVRESCEIALDMCEYENSPEFQYANSLHVVS